MNGGDVSMASCISPKRSNTGSMESPGSRIQILDKSVLAPLETNFFHIKSQLLLLSPTDCYSSYSRYAMSPFQFLFPISPSCGGLLAYPCGQPRSSLRLRVRFRARTVRLARSSKSFSAFGVLRCPYLVLPFWSMRLSRLPMLRHPRPPVLAAGVTRLDTAHSPDGVFAASSLCLAPF